ncbi:hypothetical protein M3Y98_00953500 [Aphelenchoides besseyi]|nr:hypothetical protein M3Y98_00953500 [Aphelenchoides besseyi]KAI6194596.1 hypothetical protein M3Y96_01141600 [Aphelenchoides besseyi]
MEIQSIGSFGSSLIDETMSDFVSVCGQILAAVSTLGSTLIIFCGNKERRRLKALKQSKRPTNDPAVPVETAMPKGLLGAAPENGPRREVQFSELPIEKTQSERSNRSRRTDLLKEVIEARRASRRSLRERKTQEEKNLRGKSEDKSSRRSRSSRNKSTRSAKDEDTMRLRRSLREKLKEKRIEKKRATERKKKSMKKSEKEKRKRRVYSRASTRSKPFDEVSSRRSQKSKNNKTEGSTRSSKGKKTRTARLTLAPADIDDGNSEHLCPMPSMSVSLVIMLAGVLISLVLATFNYVPGRPYELVLIKLNPTQVTEAKKIINDPNRSRAAILDTMQKWSNQQSPLIEQNLDDALFEYDQRQGRELERMEQKAKNLSVAANELQWEIRKLYNDIDLTERESCNSINTVITNATENVRNELDVQPIDCNRTLSEFSDI